MRQRDALGRTGGAAGELDVDGIVELQGFCQCRERLAVARSAHLAHVLERKGARSLWPADLDHRAQLRQPRRVQLAGLRVCELRQQRVQHLHVVGGLERGGRDDPGASDFCQCEFEFAEAVGRIDGDENEPGLGRGELRQRPFRAVQRPDADPRAGLRGRARESPRPAHRPARPAPSKSTARHGSARPAPRDSPNAGPQDRGCVRWCCQAAAHRRRRRHSYPQFQSRWLLQCVEARVPKDLSAKSGRGQFPGAIGLTAPGRGDNSRPPSGRSRRAPHRRRTRSPQRLPGTCRPRTAAPASGSRR